MNKRVNQYEIVRRLGAGAHGSVFYAYDTVLLRPAVVKRVRGEASTESTLREARLASAIDHPNVCAVYEVGTVDGDSFIAMQFLPGRPLSSWLERGPLEIRAAAAIGRQLCDGLGAAHALGIVHRDLKPSNVLVTEAGIARILDFGLAQRDGERAGPPFGTAGYMAPELFAGEPATPSCDLFALGVLIYLMVTGAHPFPGIDHAAIARSIQLREPAPVGDHRDGVPHELASTIDRALAKDPSRRFASAAEMGEALDVVLSVIGTPATRVDSSDAAPRPGPARRLLGSLTPWRKHPRADAAIAVLGFDNRGTEPVPPFYGHALASAIATRLARELVVRSPTSLLASGQPPADAIEAGRQLGVEHVLSGTFARDGDRFRIEWQLLEVGAARVRTGGALDLDTLDLVAVQSEICDDVFATLRADGAGGKPHGGPLASDSSEQYLEARALLASAMLRSRSEADLDRSLELLDAALAASPEFAPAHSARGVAQLSRVRNGFAGHDALSAAQDAFSRALQLEPDLSEARLFRVFTFMARGEKESARHAVHSLLERPNPGFDTHIVAAVVLRTDGEYDRALEQLSAALAANPAAAHAAHYHRSRIYIYRGQLDDAGHEIDRGLALVPDHPLLRVAGAYLQMSLGDPDRAVDILEAVIADEPNLHMAYPTLALARLAAGDLDDSNQLLGEPTLATAAADCETAYRVATAFAAAADRDAALAWLRTSIYLGYENHPWVAGNPLWSKIADDPDLTAIRANLRVRHHRNSELWKRLLGARATLWEP